MNVEFRLLGPLEVTLTQDDVKIGGTRQRKLLALLLLNANRVVTIEQLVDELWHAPPRSVRQQIHNAVGGLRSALAEAAEQVRITRTEGGYRLVIPPESVDLHRFAELSRAAHDAEARGNLTRAVELLDSALSVWRGTALSGLDGPAINTAVVSLNESRLAALEQLVAWRLQTGESSSLISELTQLVASHPLRESLRCSLMRALYLSGRQADALAVYEDGRKALAEELGLDPGPALRDLHLSILNGSAGTPPRGDTPDTRPTARPGPHSPKSFLPHDTIDFSGRSAELTELLDEVGRKEPTTLIVSAIDGMGGVGKTTLAIHVSHLAAASYPDGQYFVDLRGFSPGVDPLTAEQALEQLLRDSGVPPELVPSGTEARSARWRAQLAGTRSLVLLDNAVDAAQVRPLLPGSAGALVIVTSRRRLSALDGASSVTLDVLSPQEAVDMFTKVVGTRRAGHEPEAVAEAVRLCGYLPLAIRIAAARLRDRNSWTVANLVDRIRDHAHRARFLEVEDRNVMAVLKLSLRYLQPLQAKVFRLLSLHPGTRFDAHSTAALAGIAVEEAESCLDTLFDFNLVKQSSADQFHFHDLVHDCAFQLLAETEPEDERREALQRLLDYYLRAAETWCHGLSTATPLKTLSDGVPPQHVRPVTSPAEATAVMELEFPNVSAAAMFAADNGWHGHAWRLVCTLEPYLRLINYGGRSYELYESAVRAARNDGDLFGESISLTGLASVCRENGAKEEAVRHIHHAIELARALGEPNREASLHIHLGLIRVDTDQFTEAEKEFLQAKALMADDHPNRVAIMNNLAVASRELGKFDESLDHLTRSLALASAHDEASSLLTRWNIGTVLHMQRRHEAAEKEFDQVLAGGTTIGNKRVQAWARLGLCAVHRALGNLTTSVEHGRAALTLARELKLRLVECEVLNALGETAVAAGDLDHAEKVYVQAEERATFYSLTRYRARAKEGFAHVAHARGEIAEAERCWREATEIYPADMFDATHAPQHLAAIDDATVTCFRCEVE